MIITKRRRKALEKLLSVVKGNLSAMESEDVKYSVLLIEHALSKPEKHRSYEDPEFGTKIRCACGNAECFHMIEIYPDEVFFYEDESDKSADFHHFQFPKKYVLLQRKD